MLRHFIRSALSSLRGSRRDARGRILRRLAAVQKSGPVLCNLGCGTRYHPAWVNIDFFGDGEKVLPWDLRRGLPLPNDSCDVVYSSHAIEHFTRQEAGRFLDECHRTLKPGGVLRLATPNLEDITRTYLSCLEACRLEEPGAADRYEWIIIELLDQLVRHRSGGEMLRYWSRETVPAEDFVIARVGTEYRRARLYCSERYTTGTNTTHPLEVGLFRLGGEVHQWMYDTYSLGKLLGEHGFVDIATCGATDSRIVDFGAYNLDTESDGSVYKPDSFYVEAQKLYRG